MNKRLSIPIITALLLFVIAAQAQPKNKAEIDRALQQLEQQSTNLNDSSLAQYTQVLQASQQLNYTNGIIKSRIGLGTYYRVKGLYDSVVSVLRLAESLSAEVKDTANYCEVLIRIGSALLHKGDYQEAKKSVYEALNLARKAKLSQTIPKAYNSIGLLYENAGQYSKGLGFYFIALRLYEAMGDQLGQSTILNNIGSAYYYSQKNYQKCLHYWFLSIKVLGRDQHKKELSEAYSNIGAIYDEMGDQKSALSYYQKGMALAKELNDKATLAVLLNNTGMMYEYAGDYRQALSYYEQSLKLKEEIGSKRGAAIAWKNKGFAYAQLKDQQKALKAFERCLEISRQIGERNEQGEAYQGIADMYAEQRSFEKALNYTQRYQKLKDSIINDENNKQIAEIQTKYETEKKEKENALLLTTTQSQELQIAEQEKNINILIFSALSLLAIAGLYYNRYRLKQQVILAEEVAKQEKLRFKATLEAEEQERVRIAKELHDGLGQLLSTAKLNVAGLSEDYQEERPVLLTNAIQLIDEAVDEVRSISHNMMPNALIRLGLVAALKEAAAKISASQALKVMVNVSDMEQRLPESVEISCFRMIQELLNNSIKYAQAKEINIDIGRKDELLTISVADDGIGFDTSVVENSQGIGWKNLQARASLLNGTIEVNSVMGKGTTTSIKLYLQHD